MIVLCEMPDGSVQIVVPCGTSSIDDVIAKDLPKDLKSYLVVDKGALPSDRMFRNAWSKSGASVVIDMPKAREIWRQKMRLARSPKLASLDVEYMRADESGDLAKKAEISEKKDELRNVTSLAGIEEAKTPDELKAFWPKALE